MTSSLAGAIVLFAGAVSATVQAQTLATVQARGALLCGIDRSEAEYSSTDEHGNRAAFDRSLCTAVAVAALGTGARIVVTYYADDATSMQALADGRADVIASLSIREHPESAAGRPLPVVFTQPVFFDAVGLMVLRASGITEAAQLSGRKICYLTETGTEERLENWFRLHGLDLLPFPFQEEGEMEAAFVTDNCTALAGDLTRLAQTRASTGTRAGEYSILRETFGDDPLALAFRQGDTQWANLVRSARSLLIAAEERGLIRQNAASLSQSPQWVESGSPLSSARAAEVIATTGNYAEIFDHGLGSDSPLRLDRGQSALAIHGGQLKP